MIRVVDTHAKNNKKQIKLSKKNIDENEGMAFKDKIETKSSGHHSSGKRQTYTVTNKKNLTTIQKKQ